MPNEQTPPRSASSSASPVPLSREEVLILKVAELVLNRDFVDTAARVLLRGTRPASKVQDLVLRADLEELKRRCDDAGKVKWPVLPDCQSIWVIEKLWTDCMENEARAAHGYKAEGYCVSEVTADALVAEAGIFQGECWALSGQWPMRRKVKLDLLKPSP